MIQFTIEEIMSFTKEKHADKCASTIKQIIEYLRDKNKNYKAGKETPCPDNFLNEMLQQGHLPMSTYLKMREAVENPEREYEVVVI
jgi:hypothetical protein